MPKLCAKLIVLMPVYEDAEACSQLLRHLEISIQEPYCVVVVDDGSLRHPFVYPVARNSAQDLRVIRLSRNRGHQAAIAVGLRYIARYVRTDQWVVVMDSDGEDVPEAIAELVAQNEAIVDVVAASRGKRNDGPLFQLLYAAYKALFRCLTGYRMNFGNFMALRGTAVQRLSTMTTLSQHLAATVLASGLEMRKVRVDRGRRYAGRSKMNLRKLVLHGVASLAVLAPVVQRRLALNTALFAGLASVGGMVLGGLMAAGLHANLSSVAMAVVVVSAVVVVVSVGLSSRLQKLRKRTERALDRAQPFSIRIETSEDLVTGGTPAPSARLLAHPTSGCSLSGNNISHSLLQQDI